MSLLRKVIECVVAEELQGCQDDASALDPFQYVYWPRFDFEMALDELVDDLDLKLNRGKYFLMV